MLSRISKKMDQRNSWTIRRGNGTEDSGRSNSVSLQVSRDSEQEKLKLLNAMEGCRGSFLAKRIQPVRGSQGQHEVDQASEEGRASWVAKQDAIELSREEQSKLLNILDSNRTHSSRPGSCQEKESQGRLSQGKLFQE